MLAAFSDNQLSPLVAMEENLPLAFRNQTISEKDVEKLFRLAESGVFLNRIPRKLPTISKEEILRNLNETPL